jgi:predicted branched-subunit amino acid permease
MQKKDGIVCTEEWFAMSLFGITIKNILGLEFCKEKMFIWLMILVVRKSKQHVFVFVMSIQF